MHLIQAHENTKVKQETCACISNNRRIKQHGYDISVISLWALPAGVERGRGCQSVSSSPDSSAVHPDEIRELPVFPLQQDAPPSLLRKTRYTNCVLCVCVSFMGGEELWERACRPLYSHTHAHPQTSTHPSPEEGNLSAVHDVTSCIQTGPCTLYQPWMWARAGGV